MKISSKSPAKINFFLEIINKKTNGYHNIKTIMQTINLYDYIFFEKINKNNIIFKCNEKSINNKKNIVYKTTKFIKKYFKKDIGVSIYIDKKIPIGAGLGGGSSNAATTIKSLIKLWNIKTTKTIIKKIAKKIGADVPFFLNGGTSLCTGIGNIIEPLNNINKQKIIIVNPGLKILTSNIYKKVKFPFKKKGIYKIKKYILTGTFNTYKAFNTCFNRFEDFVLTDYDEIKKIKNLFKKFGCVSLMTGSGSSVFGIINSKSDIKKIILNINKHKWKFWLVNTI
jgi:4-diphosphocytidyl-2-C-methyl-D-erythritol kinase